MTPTEPPRRGRIVAFGNQKGGVTKTTTVVNIAAALSEMGQRVLIWDLDTNPSSTRVFGIPREINISGTYEVMIGEESAADVIVRPGDLEDTTLPEHVHLIPSHTKMEGLEKALANQEGIFTPVNPDLLSGALGEVSGDYDFVFLDTAPSMTPATKAAYLAAEYFVLTAIPEPLAMESLATAIRYIKQANRAGNTALRLMGVVLSQIPGRTTRLAKGLIEEAHAVFSQGDEFWVPFSTHISTSTAVPSAQKKRLTMVQYDPEHKVSQQYRDLASELMKRFEKLEGATITPAPAKALPSTLRADEKEIVNG